MFDWIELMAVTKKLSSSSQLHPDLHISIFSGPHLNARDLRRFIPSRTNSNFFKKLTRNHWNLLKSVNRPGARENLHVICMLIFNFARHEEKWRNPPTNKSTNRLIYGPGNHFFIRQICIGMR